MDYYRDRKSHIGTDWYFNWSVNEFAFWHPPRAIVRPSLSDFIADVELAAKKALSQAGYRVFIDRFVEQNESPDGVSSNVHKVLEAITNKCAMEFQGRQIHPMAYYFGCECLKPVVDERQKMRKRREEMSERIKNEPREKLKSDRKQKRERYVLQEPDAALKHAAAVVADLQHLAEIETCRRSTVTIAALRDEMADLGGVFYLRLDDASRFQSSVVYRREDGIFCLRDEKNRQVSLDRAICGGPKTKIEHINGDPFDFRRANLLVQPHRKRGKNRTVAPSRSNEVSLDSMRGAGAQIGIGGRPLPKSAYRKPAE